MNTWQILDVGSVWLKEFAFALTALAPTTSWQPSIRWTGAFEQRTQSETHCSPSLQISRFPLQRGYARFPISRLFPLGPKLIPMLCRGVNPSECALITTTPFYASVAERWLGPVVYYQTDLTVAYAGVNPSVVRAMDRRMCRVATAVCPNSLRIAAYMTQEADCSPNKITIVPNATRKSNLFERCPSGPSTLPAEVAHLRRPIAGVIGNLAANMDWQFLRSLIQGTPDFSWLFVGPTDMPVYDQKQRLARNQLLREGRALFVGSQPYSALQSYARALDVAVLPYQRQDPTYSGSSTRFYEHLAACRPMIATRGFAELLEKEPLLRLVDSAEQAAEYIDRLRTLNFQDGFEEQRWLASREGTWERRAETVMEALRNRLSGVDTGEPLISAPVKPVSLKQ